MRKFKKKIDKYRDSKESVQKLKIAQDLLAENKLSEAAYVYREILSQNPNCLDALNYLSTIYMQTDRVNDAEQILQKIIRKNRNYVKAKINLASLYENTGRLEEAVKEFMEALKINDQLSKKEEMNRISDPANAWTRLALILVKLRDINSATFAIEKAAEIDPSKVVIAMKEMAFYYLENGNFEGAFRTFNTVLKYDTRDPDIYFGLGTVLLFSQNLEEAEKNLEKALKLDPTNPKTLHNLGFIKLNTGRINEAESHFRKALELDPKYTNAWGILFVLLIKENRIEELNSLFESAMTKFQGDIEKLVEFSDELRKNGFDDYADRVITQALETKKIQSKDPKVTTKLMKTYEVYHTFKEIGKQIEMKKPNEALTSIGTLRNSIQLTTKGEKWLTSLEARCYYQIRKFDEAIINLKMIMDYIPVSEYRDVRSELKIGGARIRVVGAADTEEEEDIDDLEYSNTILKLLCETKQMKDLEAKMTLNMASRKFPKHNMIIEVMYQGLTARNKEAEELCERLVNSLIAKVIQFNEEDITEFIQTEI